jgi:hypothetical protein
MTVKTMVNNAMPKNKYIKPLKTPDGSFNCLKKLRFFDTIIMSVKFFTMQLY